MGIRSKFTVIVLALAVAISVASINGSAQLNSGKYNMANAFQNSLEVTSNITLSNSSFCVAVNDQTNRIYVGIRGALVIINGETNQIIEEIQLDQYKLGFVDAVAVNTLTNKIYAKAGFYGDKVAVIDGITNLEIGAIDQMITDQSGFAVNPVTNRIYISDYAMFLGDYDVIHVYDGETLAQIATVNIPGSNTHLYQEKVGVTVNPNTNKVYAAWSGEDTVYMIDGNTNAILKTTKVDLTKDEIRIMVNPYTDYVYVGHLQPLEGETLEEVPISSTFLGYLQAVDPFNNFLYTTDSFTDTLYRINGTTHQVIDSLELPWSVSSGDSFAVNPTTSKIYATTRDQLYVISAQTPSPSPSPTLEPTEHEPTEPEPTTPEPTEPTQAAEAPLITTELAIIATVAVACIVGIVTFWALRKRK